MMHENLLNVKILKQIFLKKRKKRYQRGIAMRKERKKERKKELGKKEGCAPCDGQGRAKHVGGEDAGVRGCTAGSTHVRVITHKPLAYRSESRVESLAEMSTRPLRRHRRNGFSTGRGGDPASARGV